MPLPEPKENETEKEFTDRCMSDKVMKKEFKKNKQRYAVCMKQWEGKNESIYSKIYKYLKG